MNILLINPPHMSGDLYNRQGRCQSRIDMQTGSLYPQLELAYIAAVLERQGYSVDLIDCMALGVNIRTLVRQVKQNNPDLLVLNFSTPTINSDLQVATQLKEIVPKALIGAIGAHVTAEDTRTIDICPELDFVVRGEPEYAILETMQQSEKGNSLSKIQGITWRDNDHKTIRNPDREPIHCLQDLPWPARHLLPNERYRHPLTGNPYTLIQVTRGCSYHCTFCITGFYEGHNVRWRDTEDILDEIEFDAIGRYNLRDIYFYSDTFTQNRDAVFNLCEGIIGRNLNINWWTNSRVDKFDLEIARIMKRSGCSLIGFGVESGVQDILDNVKKGIRLEQAEEAFCACREVGLESVAFIILGLPGENKNTISQTKKFIKKIQPSYLQVVPLAPLPGTEVKRTLQNDGLIVSEDWELTSVQPLIKTVDMTPNELWGIIRQIDQSFYLNPLYVLRNLSKIKNRNTFRFAIKRFFST